MSEKLIVLQNNVIRSGDVLHGLLESALEVKADCVLVQEPRVNTLCRHPGFQLFWERKVLTAVRIDTHLKVKVREDLAKEAEWYIQV
jgi:hypothetical protein